MVIEQKNTFKLQWFTIMLKITFLYNYIVYITSNGVLFIDQKSYMFGNILVSV